MLVDTMTYVKHYIKRPLEVEAVQISNDSIEEIEDWGNGLLQIIKTVDSSTFYPRISVKIRTSTGYHTAADGDWIIKGVDGNFYACTDEIFHKLYETNENSYENNVITW